MSALKRFLILIVAVLTVASINFAPVASAAKKGASCKKPYKTTVKYSTIAKQSWFYYNSGGGNIKKHGLDIAAGYGGPAVVTPGSKVEALVSVGPRKGYGICRIRFEGKTIKPRGKYRFRSWGGFNLSPGGKSATLVIQWAKMRKK